METMVTKMTRRMVVAFLASVVAVMAAGPLGVVHFQQDRGTHHAVQKGFKPRHPDRGYFGNCEGGFYNVSWKPKDFGPADIVQFYGQLVAPVELDKIHVVGELMYLGSHLLTINKRYSCQELTQQLISLFPRDALRFDCPIKRGDFLSGRFLFTDTEQFIGYDGPYDLHLQVMDMQGRKLMCIEVKVNILPPDY